MSKNVLFSRSHSQVEAVSPVNEEAASFIKRINIAFSKEHIAGTASLLVKHVAVAKSIEGAFKEKDWIRAGSTILGMLAMTTTLASEREGTYPEADTFNKRVILAARHPDLYSMHASLVYSTVPTVIAQINHLVKAYKQPETDSARSRTALINLAMFGLLWKTMFSNKQGIGFERDNPKAKPPTNMVKFILGDMEGLIARLLPIASQFTQLKEGRDKIHHGKEAGKDFRMGAIIGIANELVFTAYTYQQLWNAEKKKQKRNWAEEMLEKEEKNSPLSQKSR